MKWYKLIYIIIGLLGGGISGALLMIPILANDKVTYEMIISGTRTPINLYIIFAFCFIACTILATTSIINIYKK